MIELHNVSKTYGSSVKAVDDISFTVKEGEIFGLIGTSGCGKTTTLKMINRLIEPDSGQILIQGHSIKEQPVEQLRRNIGYVIQSVGLFPHYSIEKNIGVVPKLLNWQAARIRQRCNELLTLVGLDPAEFAARLPGALSGGQQQRAGLARALAADPDLLLMDEPFGALDPITKERVRGKFKELLSNLSKTVILVTHDVLEAFDLCDRICLMDQGSIQQIGAPQELLFGAKNKFVGSFFDPHRFQLEMMSVSMGDMLGFLNSGEIKSAPSFGPDQSGKGSQNNGTFVDSSTSVLSVLQQNVDVILIEENGKPVGRITREEVLQTFQKVCTHLKGGHHD